ncbi:MAG: alpha/beta hydrolase [Gammaproteobacteria bacterium]|nr:MAG: alpha/beta hydrolase [Gammaproteobacteria bacterium]
MSRWDRGERETSIPDWFWEAVETPATEHRVEVDECDVVYRRWGTPGKPPLLLIHGMYAHSHWWDFIAPQLTDRCDVAALDLTGMGDSDYRYAYDADTFAQEIVAVCDACEFDNHVVIAAHSFGGNMAVKAANLYPDRFGALVLLDSGIRDPDEPIPELPPMGGRPKLYPDKATAQARFRLQPPQSCENAYVLEYIARNSVLPIDGGYAWKFDDDLPATMKGGERYPEDYAALSLPLGVIYGADSELFSEQTLAYMRRLIPQEFPAVALADAQHHLFLDQPMAFIAALRGMLETLS